jgi:catechol 2,3-dioxygenase-like lactoylglutathione lyase family enzyme
MEEKYIISGIQQIGIGVSNVLEGRKWYGNFFGMDITMFDDDSIASLMLPYTGQEEQKRRAILALNLQGGGGFEVWQYTGRTPQPYEGEVKLGDLGILIGKMKTRDVQAIYRQFNRAGVTILGDISTDPVGRKHFYMHDLYGNLFEIVEWNDWFSNNKNLCGGPVGCVIGVSNIDKALVVYQDILGYDEVIYDQLEPSFDDFEPIPGGESKCRRVILRHSKPRRGSFSELLGSSEIELVHTPGRRVKKIYENRFWGDPGFIHLCFDINNMDALRKYCEKKGYPFVVDSSNSFEMGEAAGHFSYIEDPDGTLIEFVETHKIPVIKKINWYLDLTKRNPEKPLPRWMLKSLRFNKKAY